MKVNYVKLTAGVLTGFMALSSVPYAVYAAGPTAGVASYTSDIVSTSNTLTAGVTSMLTDVMLKGDETSETATDVATTDAEPVKSAYADTAVAQVSDSVNIRASADENSESLGKLYNNGIGTVLETTDNGWYKIQSGSVTAGCIILGVLCSLSLGVGKNYTIFGLNLFDLFDFLTAKIMLPLGGLFISIFTGWYLDKKIVWEEVSNNGTLNIHIYKLLIFILKFIAPIGIALIFINELGFLK